jgi:phage shock protein A
MADRTPHQHLEDLHAKLLATTPKDQASRVRLEQVSGDVRRTLDEGDSSSTVKAFRALRDRLAEAAVAFQVSHPEVTTELEGAIDTLSDHNL